MWWKVTSTWDEEGRSHVRFAEGCILLGLNPAGEPLDRKQSDSVVMPVLSSQCHKAALKLP